MPVLTNPSVSWPPPSPTPSVIPHTGEAFLLTALFMHSPFWSHNNFGRYRTDSVVSALLADEETEAQMLSLAVQG